MNTAIDVSSSEVYLVMDLLEGAGIPYRPGTAFVYVYSQDAFEAERIIRDAGYYCMLL